MHNLSNWGFMSALYDGVEWNRMNGMEWNEQGIEGNDETNNYVW